jgi:O-antigen ligase
VRGDRTRGSLTDRLARAAERGSFDRLTVAAGVIAAVTAALLAYSAVEHPELLRLEFSFSLLDLLGLAGAFLLCLVFFRYPSASIVLLVLFVYLNLSQILERFHGLPSLLRLLVVPMAIAAWMRHGGAAFRSVGRLGLTLLLTGYCMILLCSTTWARDAQLADERLFEHLKALVIYFLVALLASSAALVRRSLWTLLGAGATVAALGIWQVATGDFAQTFGGLARFKQAQIYGQYFKPRIAGPLGDPNFFAQILILLVPIGLFLAWGERQRLGKILALTLTAVVSAGTVLTYSRSAALVLAAVLGLSLLARRGHLREVALGVGFAVALLLALPTDFVRRLATVEEILPGRQESIDPDSSFAERRLYAGVAWQEFLERPVLGVGVGNYTAYFDDYAQRVGSVGRQYEEEGRFFAHNLYLEIGAETGVLGLIGFALSIVAGLFYLRRAYGWYLDAGDARMAGLARALEISLIGFLLFGVFLHNQYPRYPWLILGFAAAIYRVARRPSASEPGLRSGHREGRAELTAL